MLECVLDLLSALEAQWVTAWRQCRHRRTDCLETRDRPRLWHRVPLNPVITKSFSLRLHRFYVFCARISSDVPPLRILSFVLAHFACIHAHSLYFAHVFAHFRGRSRCTSTYNFVLSLRDFSDFL